MKVWAHDILVWVHDIWAWAHGILALVHNIRAYVWAHDRVQVHGKTDIDMFLLQLDIVTLEDLALEYHKWEELAGHGE